MPEAHLGPTTQTEGDPYSQAVSNGLTPSLCILDSACSDWPPSQHQWFVGGTAQVDSADSGDDSSEALSEWDDEPEMAAMGADTDEDVAWSDEDAGLLSSSPEALSDDDRDPDLAQLGNQSSVDASQQAAGESRDGYLYVHCCCRHLH